MRGLNYKTRFIDVASEVNSEMPAFWVRKVVECLNADSKALRASTVLVLGVTYKPDIDDVRESPAMDIIRLLRQQGAEVQYHDPYVPEFTEDGEVLTSIEFSAETIQAADCVIVVTDHSAIDYAIVGEHARQIVDTRNALKKRRKTCA
jgi:UDP-N-acetyl-D-glucosamine dehydrogenase